MGTGSSEPFTAAQTASSSGAGATCEAGLDDESKPSCEPLGAVAHDKSMLKAPTQAQSAINLLLDIFPIPNSFPKYAQSGIVVPEADIAARVGGDEFAVMTHGLPEKSFHALGRLAKRAAATNAAGDWHYMVSYSVGQAISELATDENFAELVARADVAMYERK